NGIRKCGKRCRRRRKSNARFLSSTTSRAATSAPSVSRRSRRDSREILSTSTRGIFGSPTQRKNFAPVSSSPRPWFRPTEKRAKNESRPARPIRRLSFLGHLGLRIGELLETFARPSTGGCEFHSRGIRLSLFRVRGVADQRRFLRRVGGL